MTKTVQSIDRAIDILKCFYKEHALGITELSRMTNLHKSTTSNLVLTLEANGFLSQSPDTKKYTLGPEICRLAANVSLNARTIALPYLNDLMQETRETTIYGVRDGKTAVYLEVVKGPHAFGSYANPGMTYPVHVPAFGRSILAFLPRNECERIIDEAIFEEKTKNTIRSREELEIELGVIRKNGYAINMEEIDYGHVCVAAPIFDAQGYPVASVSVSGPKLRLTPERIEQISKKLLWVSEQISIRLGYHRETILE